MVAPIIFGLTHEFVYVGDETNGEREYARHRYETRCPVCGTYRKESITSTETGGALYSCFGCRVLWGSVELVRDFEVPSSEEIQKYKLANPWITRR